MAKKKAAKKKAAEKSKKRSYLSQSDVPATGLDQALRICRTLAENYASEPTPPLQVAAALNLAPTSRLFRNLCGASIAYGLTEGGYNAEVISMLSLGKRITKPLEEGDDIVAKREAILKPNIVSKFLTKYNGSPLPRHDIALNILGTMNVPSDRAESVHSLIIDSAHAVGLLREIKGKQYVDLTGVAPPVAAEEHDSEDEELQPNGPSDPAPITPPIELSPPASVSPSTAPQNNRRVFVTHGKNKAFIDPIKKLLGFGELVSVVSTEKQTVSKPVPDKVMDDMRSCSAAIIHVDDEQVMIDKEAKEQVVVNPNVLIEIGAAMALYGRRFILLVRDGVQLPSNLQGLYEVRYKSDTLDGDATIRLLEAINDIKNNPTPDRYSEPNNAG